MRRRAGAALVLALLLPVTVPALAHEADPRIVTTLDAAEPTLPEGVVVQVQAGIATQLVARNETATPLEVLGRTGRPFLRISRSGVEADVGAAEFFTTSSPTGAAPGGTDDGAARWVRISAGDSWGWYDHRLHPDQVRAPAEDSRPARLASFEVPLRYGAQDVVVRGSVDFSPLLGAFLVSADVPPPGLSVQALPGRLPGLFLTAEPDTDVEVAGRDGEPFLRISERGVEVNVRSRTHVEDRAARGQAAGPPSTEVVFELVAPGARTYTWLDARLRYPDDLPPEPALTADGPTRLQPWQVPVQVDGEPAVVTGSISWVPEADAARQVGARAAEPDQRTALPYALAAVVAGVLGGAVLLLRRRSER